MSKFIFLRLFSFVGYCVFYSTLTLFLLSKGMDKSTVVLYTSSFIALNYFFTIAGGWFLGWVYDYKKLLILGGLLYFIAAVLFFVQHDFILGLTVFVMGSLFFDSTFILLVTRLFEDQKQLLQKAFFLSYLGMNIGGLIGFGLGGWFQKTSVAWPIISVLFLCLCGIVITLALTWKSWPLNPEALEKPFYLRIIALGSMVIAGCLLYGLFSFQALIQPVIVCVWGLVFCILLFRSCWFWQRPESAGLRRFLQLVFIFMIFISIYYLIPTMILLFLAHDVTNSLFGLAITPAWFLNIMCLVVIFGMIWNARCVDQRPFNLYRQFRLGMILTFCAAMSLFIGVISVHSALVPMGFVALYFILQSLAEVSIAPISYTSVAECITIRQHHPYFIGFWLATYSIGMINSGLIAAKIVPHLSLSLQDNPLYAKLFLGMAACALFGFALSYLKTGSQPLNKIY